MTRGTMRRLLPWCVILTGCAPAPVELSSVPLAGETRPVEPDAFIQMVSGTEHSCGLREDGEVWCWGDNRYGELGIVLEAPYDLSVAKRRVAGLGSVVELAAGARHTCALQRGGAVWCWGAGWHGRLGNGGDEDAGRPVRVIDVDDALAITAGDDHSCALREASGDIVCWGQGQLGQLGEGHVGRSSSVPVVVASGRGVVQLVSTSATTCARTSSGHVSCWGGWDGHAMPELRRPVGARGVTQLTADKHSICALGPDPGTLCWDANDLEHPRSPARVDGSVQLGAQHCVIDDGRAQCWRALAWIDTPPLRPVELAVGARVVSLTHGQRHACVSLVSGETLCWGDNARGQLGGARVTGPTANPWLDTDPTLVDDRFVCEPGQIRVGEAGVEQWCVDAGLRHGPSVRYHPNGQLAESGHYERGRREGTWRTWHDRGAPATTGPWVAGLRQGQWTVHAGEDGWTGAFEGGVPHGAWVFRTSAGVVLRELEFEYGEQRLWIVRDPDNSERVRLEQSRTRYLLTTWTHAGARSESQVLLDERPSWSIEDAPWQAQLPTHFVMHGAYRRYEPGGVMVEQGRHARSLREGTWRRWYDGGELCEQTDYAANQRHGRSQAWYVDGQLQYDGQFERDRLHGTWTRWYEDGQRQEQGTFDFGARVGTHRSWHASGQLQSRRDVDSGAFTTWYENGGRRAQGRTSVMADIVNSTSLFGAPLCAETAGDVASSMSGLTQGDGLTSLHCTGQPHGRWRLWWEDGTLAADGRFSFGQPVDAWRYWDEDGSRLRDPCRSKALVDMFAAEQVDLGCGG